MGVYSDTEPSFICGFLSDTGRRFVGECFLVTLIHLLLWHFLMTLNHLLLVCFLVTLPHLWLVYVFTYAEQYIVGGFVSDTAPTVSGFLSGLLSDANPSVFGGFLHDTDPRIVGVSY